MDIAHNNRLVGRLRRIGMKKRLRIGFLMVSIIPATILIFILSVSFYQRSVEDYNAQAVQTIGEMQYRMELLMERQWQVLDEFASDSEIVKCVRKLEMDNDAVQESLLRKGLRNQLLTDVNKGTSHMRAEILNQEGEPVAGIFDEYYADITDTARAQVVSSGERQLIWHGRAKESEEAVLVFARKIINYYNGSEIGWVVTYQGTHDIAETLQEITTDTQMAVYGKDGEVIYCSEGTAEGMERNALSRYSDSLGWTLAVSRESEALDQLMAEMALYAGLIYVLVVGVIIYLSFLITKTITEPLAHVQSGMQRFSNGNLKERVHDTGEDELAVLAQEFNRMCDNIEHLTVEVYQAQVREKEAELKALEAQINPHFLYNTLDMVNWMSYRSAGGDAYKILRCLSDFFRLSLNQGKEIYTVADEVKHVQCYITIEQYKKANVVFEVDADPEIRGYPCPKLIVQPLVENALVHGLEPKKMNGTVRVCFSGVKDKIQITVSDDGVGLTEHPKEKDLYQSSHYGLKNINERLKMLYGAECEVELSENIGGGMTAKICLPRNPLRGE